MKKLLNPYVKYGKDFNCFVCSPFNKIGLKLDFFEDEDKIIAEWEPHANYSSFHGVLHGGIQATLLDEIANWLISVKLDTSGVTSKLEVDFKKTVKIDNKKVYITSEIVSVDKKYAVIHAKLFNTKKEICATAKVTYRIFPKQLAKEKLYFPGKEAFYVSQK